jgi:deoxycytidine triphosphate deaminase
MAIKSDRWIRRMAQEHGMINPFNDRQVREGVISYGVSSYGYDLRVADEFKIFTNVNSAVVDPKNFDERSFVSVQANNIVSRLTMHVFRIFFDVGHDRTCSASDPPSAAGAPAG